MNSGVVFVMYLEIDLQHSFQQSERAQLEHKLSVQDYAGTLQLQERHNSGTVRVELTNPSRKTRYTLYYLC
jgi:hypothetical protein